MRTFIYSVVAAATMALAGISSAFAQGHIIIVNANAPGVGFNDPTPAAPVGGNTGTTLGEQRLNVFAFAANIWEQTLQPRTDIFVIAQFAPLGPNVLGCATGEDAVAHAKHAHAVEAGKEPKVLLRPTAKQQPVLEEK